MTSVDEGRTLEKRKEALRRLLPAVERLRGVREVEWSGSGRAEDGVYTCSYPVYDQDTLAIMEACGGEDLTSFDYIGVLERRGLAGREPDLERWARDADEELTLALLTAVIRSERFCDGSVAAAVKDGTLVALLDRLRQVYGM